MEVMGRVTTAPGVDLRVESKVYRHGMSEMRISQLAQRTGVPATTLRFYETAGLLPAERTAAGYRVYGEDAIERLGFIGSAKHLGLALEEISELLSVWTSGPCQDVKADLRPRLVARIVGAQDRAAELAAFTTRLQDALERLDALPDRLHRCDAQCLLTRVEKPISREPDRWRTAPVACSLDGAEAKDRAPRWHELLAGAVREVIEDGVRLRLPTQRAGQIAALAAEEQQCCPFFDFRLHLDGPMLALEVRAPASGADLLKELFTPPEQRA